MQLDAVFATVTDGPIFDGASQRDTVGAQFGLPLFSVPDESDAGGFIAADSLV
jgi:hypothetical protein